MQTINGIMGFIIRTTPGGWLLSAAATPKAVWTIGRYEGGWAAVKADLTRLGVYPSEFAAYAAVLEDMQARGAERVEHAMRTDLRTVLDAYADVLGVLESYAKLPEAERLGFWEGVDDPMIVCGRALIEQVRERLE